MVVRLKGLIKGEGGREGGLSPFAWDYFKFCFFEGRGHIFGIFLYFLGKVRYVFMKFCKDIIGITLTITQKIIWHVACVLQGYFEVF